MDITRRVAEFAATTGFGDIPEAAVHDTKRIILDEIGCALAGYATEQGPQIIATVKPWGGTPEATIIGSGDRTSAPLAAFVNAKTGNLYDSDDVFLNSGHQSPMIFFPALAVAQATGSSGTELITSFAVGFDVASRIILALGSVFERVGDKVVNSEAVGFNHAIFGSSAAVGSLLNLSAEQMQDAFGQAAQYTPSPTGTTFLQDITPSKIGVEATALGGLMAAYLARNGYRGQRTILDTDYYAKAMGKRTYNWERLVDNLGERWYISETSIKPYPHCRHTHYALCLIERIVAQTGIGMDDIKDVLIRGLGSYSTTKAWATAEPQDQYQGQFSVPYGTAMLAMHLPPGPKWQQPGLAKDPKVQDFMKRVRYETEPRIAALMLESLPKLLREYPTTVTITTTDGRVFTESTVHAKGDGFSEEWRLSDDEVVKKFTTHSEGVLSADKLDRLVEAILGLERIENVQALHELLH